MNDRFHDPIGTGGAFLVGAVLGLALSVPMLPREISVAEPEISVGPVGGYLLVSVLVMALLPLCIILLHVAFVQADR